MLVSEVTPLKWDNEYILQLFVELVQWACRGFSHHSDGCLWWLPWWGHVSGSHYDQQLLNLQQTDHWQETGSRERGRERGRERDGKRPFVIAMCYNLPSTQSGSCRENRLCTCVYMWVCVCVRERERERSQNHRLITSQYVYYIIYIVP